MAPIRERRQLNRSRLDVGLDHVGGLFDADIHRP